MKKGFEDAYSLFAGFNFANAQSRENALWLLHWLYSAELGVQIRWPLVVISGPPGSGKSKLIDRLAEEANVEPFDGYSAAAFDTAAGAYEPLLVFTGEGIADPAMLTQLCQWLTAREWQTRKVKEPIMLSTVTVWHKNGDEPIPADLQRRSIFIRLVARD